MKIGFDLDKVFIDYPPLLPSVLFDKFYKKKDNGVLLYRIPSYPDQLLRKALHQPFLRPPIKENVAILKNISKKEHKLYLISSRYKFLEGLTTKLVKRYHLDKIFDGMYFNFDNEQPHEFKNAVLKKLNLDMYIDDDLSLIKYVAKHNPKTKFFWLDHNASGKVLGGNIHTITTLADIFPGTSTSRQKNKVTQL